MPRVFISYATDDWSRVEQIAAFLRTHELDVWWDRNLNPGEHFQTAIRRAIEAADAVVVVWTETSITRDWVLDEALAAQRANKLVPIQLDDCRLPLSFGQIHACQLQRWDRKSVTAESSQLLRTLWTLAGRNALDELPVAARGEAGALPPLATTARPAWLPTSRRWLASLAVGATMAAAGVVYAISTPAEPRTPAEMDTAALDEGYEFVRPFAGQLADRDSAEYGVELVAADRYLVLGHCSDGCLDMDARLTRILDRTSDVEDAREGARVRLAFRVTEDGLYRLVIRALRCQSTVCRYDLRLYRR